MKALIAVVLCCVSSAAISQGVYEGQIDGEYQGWPGEKIYQLLDGHIIQQADYHYHYHYAFSPKVIIYRSNNGELRMHVQGDDDTQDTVIKVLK